MWVSPYYEDELAALRDLIGADHMLMGSDYPHAEGLAEPSAYIKDLENFGFTPEDSRLVMRDNGRGALAPSSRVTTLVWPSEAVPESVLTTLTGPGAPFELREERRARRVRCSCSPTGRGRSSSCCAARPNAWATSRT